MISQQHCHRQREEDTTNDMRLAFDILKGDMVIANCDATVFNTCSEQIESFIYPYAKRFSNSNMPLHFHLLNNLEVSYLGAETNMLYITERGSLEDSLTYKNITLKIRYKDNSLTIERRLPRRL